jgi:hypothetical protein
MLYWDWFLGVLNIRIVGKRRIEEKYNVLLREGERR